MMASFRGRNPEPTPSPAREAETVAAALAAGALSEIESRGETGLQMENCGDLAYTPYSTT
jgi:hypothetical protein